MTSTLAGLNQQLLESGDFADVEIICQGRIWKAHQAILAARSPWSKRALSGAWTEATTRKIHLDAVNPDLVDILIKYIYTDELPEPDERHRTTTRSLEDNVQLFIQADFFLLVPLRVALLRRLRESFCQSITEHFCFNLRKPTRVEEYLWVSMSPTKVSKRSLPGLLEDLYNATRLAYSIRTARDLHRTVIAFSLCLRTQIDIADLEDLSKKIPDFQADLQKVTMALLFDYELGSWAGTKSLAEKAFDRFEAAKRVCAWCGATFKFGGLLFVTPLPDADDTWCENCAQQGFSVLINELFVAMPL